jgi:hypothetical protein
MSAVSLRSTVHTPQPVHLDSMFRDFGFDPTAGLILPVCYPSNLLLPAFKPLGIRKLRGVVPIGLLEFLANDAVFDDMLGCLVHPFRLEIVYIPPFFCPRR